MLWRYIGNKTPTNYYAASPLHNSTTIRNPQIYFVNRYFLMFSGFQIRASYPASRNDVRVLKPWYQKRVHEVIHPWWCTPSWTLFTLICIAIKLCVPVQIYENEKGKYREVSPVIFTYVQIPTLALSKSGIRVEVDYFLSACEYKLPCLFTWFSIWRKFFSVKVCFVWNER